MQTINNKELGRISVHTLELPEFVLEPSGTYLPSGQILLDYHKHEDTQRDFIRLAVVDDDGSGFQEFFSGIIPTHGKANGIRFMPYQDGKRVLLGDYVLECEPDISSCKQARIVPVVYPWGLQEDPKVFKSWSEIVISQDNHHICWTILLNSGGATVALGRLDRNGDRYEINDAVIISSEKTYEEDKDRPGYVLPKKMLGGEVKQFVHGGTAISLVGAGIGALPDSVIQDLMTGEVIALTNSPGYEETTILSPDEKLGMVMSTRASDKTNFAILGLLPRPYAALITMGLSLQTYMYAVASVRRHRPGNIGPVLISLEQSMNDSGYMGIALNDPDNQWVYLSPMSWHPQGKKAMWPEMKRGDYSNKRIRIVELLDYQPQASIPIQVTQLDIPYALSGEYATKSPAMEMSFKIAGKHSGEVRYEGSKTLKEKHYIRFSDDGINFYNGFERMDVAQGITVYEADLSLKGATDGEMKCRIAFSGGGHDVMPDLLFENGVDGLPQTRGFARYGNKTVDISIMR